MLELKKCRGSMDVAKSQFKLFLEEKIKIENTDFFSI